MHVTDEMVRTACDAWLEEAGKMRGGDEACMRVALERVFSEHGPTAWKIKYPDGYVSLFKDTHLYDQELRSMVGSEGFECFALYEYPILSKLND